jgi:hypothetical protein
MTTGRINQVTILTAGDGATRRDPPPRRGGRAVHQRSGGRRRPPAPRSPEQKLHRSPRAIQFLPQSSPEGGPPYRRSGCHRPPSRSRTYTPQEEDTRSRSRQGRLPARAFPRVRADNDGHQPTVHRLHRRLPSHGGRQDLSRLCDPNSSAGKAPPGPGPMTMVSTLADPRSAHGQGRCGYGTMHVADATGYRCRGVRVCIYCIVLASCILVSHSVAYFFSHSVACFSHSVACWLLSA